MLTAAQRKERLGYIGASEAAAVLGLSRWGTPLSVWAEKTGQVVREESDALHQKLGHKMEPVVAELFEEETGKKVELVPATLFHPVHKFIACNLDRRVVGENAIVQLKTCASWKWREWEEDEIPREYILQEIHELAVTGADRVYIPVLIGNQDFKIKIIERRDVLGAIDDLVAREVHFWETFVVPRVMPTHITARDRDTLETLFPVAEAGPPVQLPDTANAIAENLESMEQDLKMIKGQIEKQKNELLAMLGAHEAGTTGRWEILWANKITRRFDTEKFKKEHPKLYEDFRKANTSRTFVINQAVPVGE